MKVKNSYLVILYKRFGFYLIDNKKPLEINIKEVNKNNNKVCKVQKCINH